MLINEEGFELGAGTDEEMVRHQVLLLEHENEEAWRAAAKARSDVQALVEINARLNSQIGELHLQLRQVQSRLMMEVNLHKPMFSTWGGAGDKASRGRSVPVYPEL
ncbi:hypothetical protein K3F44_18050 [Pseudomonas sp. S07E 245]|uniref:hypothetical protein n=1 Tax=Pseudomonas sp. S07E 245 TaxID=2866278 RepID=UPI001C73D285|nr:hypothetical protein [Pseudomonas sp. S07E 245]QYX51495.1 hypothetical protein K3F44_18050 [Pseudomonas sp. S07E 245]